MNKLLLTALSLLVSAGMASARTISVEEAQSIATEFISGGNSGMLKKQGAALQSADLEASHLYGFNIAGGGYVIVSGDSRTYQILGYSDSGSLDLADMPEPLQAWINSYDSTIAALGALPLAEGSEPVSLGAAIEPMLKTTWYQDAPYNDPCPTLPNDEGVDEKCPTGCVATAMAQVMYYHQWPASSPVIPEYSFTYTATINEERTYTMPELPATTFAWDDMLLDYHGVTSTEAQNVAVSTLMLYCGQSLHMKYAPEGSGCQESAIAQALRYYFDYDKALYSAKRVFYSIDEWEQLIYSELAAGRPVPYAGDTETSGHSFVCDGYDGAGMFHINWGWGGKADGYFSLSVLNPYDNISIGSSQSHIGYAINQEAVIGVQRPIDGSVQVDDDFYMTLYCNIGVDVRKNAYITILYESIFNGVKATCALATIDGDAITPVVTTESMDYYDRMLKQCIFPLSADDFAVGTTNLYPVVRVDDGAHQWQRLASDAYYIKVEKTADSFEVTSYPDPFFADVEMPSVAFENPDQQINEPAVINIDFALDSEYTGELFYTIFEAGSVELSDPEVADIMQLAQNTKYTVFTNGYAVRAGEAIHEAIKYTPQIPGNLYLSIWRGKSDQPIVINSNLKVGGILDYVDIEVFDYDIQSTEDGEVYAEFLLRNNDVNPFNTPENSAAGIYAYVEGYEDEYSQVTGVIAPASETKMVYENYLDIDGIEPGIEITIVVVERYDLKTAKELFRKTFRLGENLQSAIDTLIDPAAEGNVWYNLQGVRINEPTIPGIYIHNGAKVVIR